MRTFLGGHGLDRVSHFRRWRKTRPTRVTPDALAWKENAAFPKGVQIATPGRDPTKAEDVLVLRIKFPLNFQMLPHTHPYSEVVTVIRGNIGSSYGESFEKKASC